MPHEDSPSIALFQPEIPGNTGALMRLAACMDVELHVIEPAAFRLDDKALKRAGMDYAELAALHRHLDWNAFDAWRRGAGRRLVLFTTRAQDGLWNASFRPGDILLFGRESSGAPQEVHDAADLRLRIPMAQGMRSLNLALAASMALGEALRQQAAKRD
jgi:tRNA (cytidine/uridine-2'-O-)-methyltransferase